MFSPHLKPALALIALSALVMTGCSGTETETQDRVATSSASAESSSGLTVDNAWAKAAESGMTAVFGQVTNTGEQAVTVTGASSSATDAGNTQLHATELDSATGSTAMKQVENFSIRPGETLTLEPGGNHIMLMHLTCSLPAGSSVKVTLTVDNGDDLEFTAQARDYSGAQESYAPGEENSAGETASEHSGHADTQDHATDSEETALPRC